MPTNGSNKQTNPYNLQLRSAVNTLTAAIKHYAAFKSFSHLRALLVVKEQTASKAVYWLQDAPHPQWADRIHVPYELTLALVHFYWLYA